MKTIYTFVMASIISTQASAIPYGCALFYGNGTNSTLVASGGLDTDRDPDSNSTRPMHRELLMFAKIQMGDGNLHYLQEKGRDPMQVHHMRLDTPSQK